MLYRDCNPIVTIWPFNLLAELLYPYVQGEKKMKQSEIEMCIAMYGKDLYSFCCYLTYSKQEADDLYQDTFVKVIELGKIDMSDNPKSYLLSIAVRLWKNRKRKLDRRRQVQVSDSTEELEKEGKVQTEQSPEQEMIQKEQKECVQRVVRQLPDKLCIVVLLYYMEDRKIPEIAEIIHVPQGTVKSRLHKARKILREKLEDVV